MESKVIVEHRPRLQICQFYIIMKCQDTNQDIAVKILANSVEISVGRTELKIELNEIQLIPLSLSGLTVEENGLNFSVQTSSHSTRGSYKTEILSKDSKPVHSYKYLPQIELDSPVHIFCNCCLSKITSEPLVFSRLLPLPTSNFEATDLFCHQDKQNILNVAPKKKDCLYGSYFVLIKDDFLNYKSDVLRCERCFSWLGTSNSNGVHLWNSTILFAPKKPSARHDNALSDFISVVNENIDDEVCICKIMMECKISPNLTHYLLLWIMERNLKLLISPQDTPGHVLREHSVIKLLYHFETKKNEMIDTWKKDFYVRNVEVSQQMMVEGLNHLSSMMLYIPSKFRIVNNMYVSYIGIIKN